MIRQRRRRSEPGASPTVGLALMVHNEEHNLPNLLDCIEGAFDQIAFVDNADPCSDDATLEIFRDWCADTGQPHIIDQFAWTDDYSAKRNYTQGLLTTDWICWTDADDTIHGADNLRALAAEAPSDLAAYELEYDFIYDENDELIGGHPRERLVRRHLGTWMYRVHELQRIDGPRLYADRGVAHWVHRPRTPEEIQADRERDRRIFDTWEQDEPDNQWISLHRTYKAIDQLVERQVQMNDAVKELCDAFERAHLDFRIGPHP